MVDVRVALELIVEDRETVSAHQTNCSVTVFNRSTPQLRGRLEGQTDDGGGPGLGPQSSQGQTSFGHGLQPWGRRQKPSQPKTPHFPLQPNHLHRPPKPHIPPITSQNQLMGQGILSLSPLQPGPNGRPSQPQPQPRRPHSGVQSSVQGPPHHQRKHQGRRRHSLGGSSS